MLELHKNDRSNGTSILAIEILSSEVICSCPGAIYMYQIMKKSM